MSVTLKAKDGVYCMAQDGTPITAEMVDGWCEAYDAGRLPDGYAVDGGVRKGRPRLSAEGMASMTVRVPRSQKEALAREAAQRGMDLSGYVREILALRTPA